MTIADGLNTLFGPADQKRDSYVTNMVVNGGLEFLGEFLQSMEVNGNEIIVKFPRELDTKGKVGLTSFIIGMGFTTIDELWGETYTGPVNLAQVHQEVNVVTGRADNITKDSAELYGYVSPVATAPFGEKIVTEIYIVLWKAEDESHRKNHSVFYSDGGTVSFTFIHLEPDTEYCYQLIFEDVDNRIYRYGEVNTFKTKGDEGERWVDLGLSVLWAAYNVGASSPEEYGGYYAWGETSTKSDYTFENYKHRERTDYDHEHRGDDCWCWHNKFIGNEISGTSYDVAHVQWGGGARMPTLAEVQELVDNCTFIGGSYNGVRGSYVTGPNGNSIFLPFAGSRSYGDLDTEGISGFFWSGTYHGGSSGDYGHGYYAYFLCCHADLGYWSDGYRRLYGLSVRPVTEK